MSFTGTSIIKNNGIAPISEQRPTGIEKEVYEVFRVENKKPLFMVDHLKRFENSLQKAGKSLPLPFDQLGGLIDWLILCNPISDANIRLSLLPDGLFQAGFIRSKYPTTTMYAQGVLCLLMHQERENPSAKVFHAQMRQSAETIRKERNAYELPLVDHLGRITEGSRSNIFFIKENQLVTAPSELVLEGIMRAKVLELATQKGIPIRFEAINTKDVSNMEAAFITGTSPRILPIRQIEAVNLDVEHPLMRQLMEELNHMIQKRE